MQNVTFELTDSQRHLAIFAAEQYRDAHKRTIAEPSGSDDEEVQSLEQEVSELNETLNILARTTTGSITLTSHQRWLVVDALDWYRDGEDRPQDCIEDADAIAQVLTSA